MSVWTKIAGKIHSSWYPVEKTACDCEEMRLYTPVCDEFSLSLTLITHNVPSSLWTLAWPLRSILQIGVRQFFKPVFDSDKWGLSTRILYDDASQEVCHYRHPCDFSVALLCEWFYFDPWYGLYFPSTRMNPLTNSFERKDWTLVEINWDVFDSSQKRTLSLPWGFGYRASWEVFSPSLIMKIRPKATASSNLSWGDSDDVFMSFAMCSDTRGFMDMDLIYGPVHEKPVL